LAFAGASQSAVLLFQDDDIDFALNHDGTLKATGVLAVGDILAAVFEIPTYTINGVNAIPAGSELTGVAAVQIETITDLGGGISSITFKAPDIGLNAVLANGTDPDATVDDGDAGEGATIAMWFNGTAGGADRNLILDVAADPASNCTSLADCIDQATLGTLVQVDGFAGDPDEFWSSVALPGGLSIDAVRGTNNTAIVATFLAAQTTFFNLHGIVGPMDIATGNACPGGGAGADGCIVGGTVSGTIAGGQGLVNGAFAHSDLDARKLTVPEPGSLLLLASGLLGLAGLRRRS
jgi:hypothetical protein